MDPLRIIVRVLFAYIVLLVLVRVSGKRTVKQGSPFDFTVALIVGDLVDDEIWGEIDTAVFIVAVGTLMLVHTAFDLVRYRTGVSR
jgi:uncharacterized membrane protein YcaP (DUF421 family)